MELEGYNKWKEYPDEIYKGSLIRIGDDLLEVIEITKLDDGIFELRLEAYEYIRLHLSGTIRIDGNRVIETYTKHPS